jgi:hypothetical protein
MSYRAAIRTEHNRLSSVLPTGQDLNGLTRIPNKNRTIFVSYVRWVSLITSVGPHPTVICDLRLVSLRPTPSSKQSEVRTCA